MRGDEHGANGEPSSEHSNVENARSAPQASVALPVPTIAAGWAVIVVCGVPSTFHVTVAGVASVRPFLEARTLKVCVPRVRLVYVRGDEQGAKAALPMWMDVMQGYIASRADQPAPPQFQAPGNIVFVPIDRSTGAATTQESAATITETFIAGTEPGGLNRAQSQQP